jgi:hypothetical protein
VLPLPLLLLLLGLLFVFLFFLQTNSGSTRTGGRPTPGIDVSAAAVAGPLLVCLPRCDAVWV